MNNKIFSIKYPSGEMRVNVGEFFGSQEQRKIKKLFQFAAYYCFLEQRMGLLDDLKWGIRKRKEILDSCQVLEQQKIAILTPFFGHKLLPNVSGPEKELKRQITRLEKSIATLEEVWPV